MCALASQTGLQTVMGAGRQMGGLGSFGWIWILCSMLHMGPFWSGVAFNMLHMERLGQRFGEMGPKGSGAEPGTSVQ